MHFLEPARFLNAPYSAGRKDNLLYDPGLAQRPPPTAHQGRKVFGPRNNHSVLICIKLPMNLLFYMALAPYDFDVGQRHYMGGLGHWKGLAMKVLTFLGQNSSRFARAVSGPKKVSTFMAQPFQWPA